MTVLGALARARETRAVQATPWGEWPGEGGGQTWSGAPVTTGNATQLLTVYGCNRFICDGISTLPVDAFTDTAGTKREVDKPTWLVRPTVDLAFIPWSTQVLTSLLLGGNAYLYKSFRGTEIVELIPLDPTVVKPKRIQGRKAYTVNGTDVDGFEILHIPGVMYPGADTGMSPVEAARQSIGVGMAAQEFGAKFFGQGAVMSGVIESQAEGTPDKAREMAKAWGRAHSGKSKSHLPGVLFGGATWKPTGVTNDQAQFLETRQFTAAEIAAQMFLIDPADLGIGVNGSSLTYANLTERNLRRVQVTYLPWIVRLEMALSSLMPSGQYVKFNVAGLLRGDMKTRFETYQIGRENEIITLDEIRDWEELAPLPERAAQPPALVDQIEAVGQLIRAGFEPAASLAFLGLPEIKHTGLVPITVAAEETPTTPTEPPSGAVA